MNQTGLLMFTPISTFRAEECNSFFHFLSSIKSVHYSCTPHIKWIKMYPLRAINRLLYRCVIRLCIGSNQVG